MYNRSADSTAEHSAERTADARSREAAFIGAAYPLTLAGKRSGEGYFDSEADKLVFQSERDPKNPFYQMFVLDLTSGATELVSTGVGKSTCGWFSPEGDKVLFSSTHLDPSAKQKQQAELEFRASGKSKRYSWDYDEHYEIFSRSLKSKKLVRLTTALGYDAEASWSPTGEHILFASNQHAYREALSAEDAKRLETDPASFIELYRMNFDGTGVERLTYNNVYDGGPFYNSEGTKITWRRFSADGKQAEIFIADPDGRNERQLTKLGALSWAPFFHPSGEYLVFTTNLHGFENFELYIVRTDGSGEPARVSFTPGFDGLPVFSPNGQTLSWSTKRGPDGTVQIFAASWNDAHARATLALPPVEPYEAETDSALVQLAAAVQQHVAKLSSDEFDGRLTGTDGERRATQYAADQLASYGFVPAGDNRTFFESFNFTAGVSLAEGNQLSLTTADRTATPTLERDWIPLSFTQTGEIAPAPVVFVGYGIRAPAFSTPDGEKFQEYDSYVHLDVKDKWVLAFRDLPGGVHGAQKKHLQQHSSLRFKAMLARSLGARGILFVSGPQSMYRNKLVPLAFDASQSGSEIAAISISDELADELLSGEATDLEKLQNELLEGALRPGFEIKNSRLAATIAIRFEQRVGRNVLAALRAPGKSLAPAVVIGAHIDHLGHGTGGSLARDSERGQIHPGADDNASGVAAILEISKALAEAHRAGATMERDLVVALWSGEELGLLGSSHYVSARGRKPAVAAYVNLDMVGRARNGTLIIQGVGSGDRWLSEVERANAPVGLGIVTQNDSYLPTDATSFYLVNIPILSGFTGVHEEYHSPRDTAEKLNYADLARITLLFQRITQELLQTRTPPTYQKMEKPEHLGRRANLRAYLGSIPDYSGTAVQGVKLSGVTNGAPAAKAGLRAGDIIISLAGTKITNIYDYTYAIEALEIGKSIEVVLVREGEELRLNLTPGSRE